MIFIEDKLRTGSAGRPTFPFGILQMDRRITVFDSAQETSHSSQKIPVLQSSIIWQLPSKSKGNEMNSKDGDDAVDISREELQALHEKRMRKILEIAWKKENEVVILGAFGCGAFCNPPSVVAQAMKTVIQEYRMNFETIEFAVYCSMQYDTNYRIFQQILGGM